MEREGGKIVNHMFRCHFNFPEGQISVSGTGYILDYKMAEMPMTEFSHTAKCHLPTVAYLINVCLFSNAASTAIFSWY